MLPRDAKPEAAKVPCACCGQAAGVCVWQLDLCATCLGAWNREVAPPPCHYEWPLVTPQPERDKQWERATAEWLKRAKARAA